MGLQDDQHPLTPEWILLFLLPSPPSRRPFLRSQALVFVSFHYSCSLTSSHFHPLTFRFLSSGLFCFFFHSSSPPSPSYFPPSLIFNSLLHFPFLSPITFPLCRCLLHLPLLFPILLPFLFFFFYSLHLPFLYLISFSSPPFSLCYLSSTCHHLSTTLPFSVLLIFSHHLPLHLPSLSSISFP